MPQIACKCGASIGCFCPEAKRTIDNAEWHELRKLNDVLNWLTLKGRKPKIDFTWEFKEAKRLRKGVK